MAPVIARVGLRAIQRPLQRRQFSMIGSLRSFARSLEAHPFERLPVTQKPQPADWSRQFKRIGSQAAIYFPGLALILGWPWMTAPILNGKIGKY